MELFEDSAILYRDIFPPAEPFRSLYAVHALTEYLDAVKKISSRREGDNFSDPFPDSSYPSALVRVTSLLSQAISDPEVLNHESPGLQLQLLTLMMSQFRRLLDGECPATNYEECLFSANRPQNLVTIS